MVADADVSCTKLTRTPKRRKNKIIIFGVTDTYLSLLEQVHSM